MLLGLVALASYLVVAQTARAATPCAIDGSPDARAVLVQGICAPISAPPARGDRRHVVTKTIYCGQPRRASDLGLWNAECGPKRVCWMTDKASGRRHVVDVFATLTLINGRWTAPRTWCPVDATGIDAAALRERAVRLLPRVAIGSAWTTIALVNAETILWAVTAPDRALATVTVVGQPVQLRVHFVSAHWDYGDGSRETTTTPGKPYDKVRDPCETAQCAHYAGHTYTNTGRVVITLAVTWHAQYRLGTGHWIDITGDITGPTARHTLTVKQVRGVLVPNP